MNTWRGHNITEMSGGEWQYEDTGEIVALNPNRECGHCGLENTIDGHDGCLGSIRGVLNACCGHGIESDRYIQFRIKK